MRKKIVYLLLFLLFAIVQLSFIPVVSNSKPAANLVLMAILAWSVIDGYFSFFTWSIVLGFIYDFISFSPFGLHALIFLLVVYLVSFFSRRLSVEISGVGNVMLLLLVFVANVVLNVINALAFSVGSPNFLEYWNFFDVGSIFIQFLYNAILFFICLGLIKKVKSFYLIS